MKKFVTLWTTKTGTQFAEEPQEFASMEAAAQNVLPNMTFGEGEDDRIFFKDIEGNMVILRSSRIDNVVILPAEKVNVNES